MTGPPFVWQQFLEAGCCWMKWCCWYSSGGKSWKSKSCTSANRFKRHNFYFERKPAFLSCSHSLATAQRLLAECHFNSNDQHSNMLWKQSQGHSWHPDEEYTFFLQGEIGQGLGQSRRHLLDEIMVPVSHFESFLLILIFRRRIIKSLAIILISVILLLSKCSKTWKFYIKLVGN